MRNSSIFNSSAMRIIYRVAFYGLMLAVALITLYFLSGFITKNHRLGTTYLKHKRLESIDEKKVILIGGSNLHYGYDSELLEDSLSASVINMGIQASIGLRFYFNEIMDEVEAGDIIVLLAEPAHFAVIDIDGQGTLYNLISKYPAGLKYLNQKQIVQMPYHMGHAIKDNFDYFLQLSMIKYLKKSTVLEETNKWGDYTGHKGKSSIYKPRAINEAATEFEISQKTIFFLKEMAGKIEAKGAHLYISFAPTAISAANEELFGLIEKLMEKDFQAYSLGNAKAHIFPDSFFFDTHHHLLYEKRAQRSLMLLNDLKQHDKQFSLGL